MSVTQLQTHRRHHVHLKVFRWRPLRRRRTRRCHWSVPRPLPFRQLTRGLGKSARSSDAGGVSLRQLDAPIDDATVDADLFFPIYIPPVPIVKDRHITGVAIGGRSLTGTDDVDAMVAAAVAEIMNLCQFSRPLSFHANTG